MYPKRMQQLRALLLEAAMVLTATGCTGWRVEPNGLQAALDKHPARLRVTGTDSSRVVMLAPAQVGDTLVGKSAVRIPTATIGRVETRARDGAKTAALLGGAGLLVLVGLVAAQNSIENQLWR